MLCRTANELFWMSRHIERAENTARMLDVTYRMSLLPYDVVEPGLAWAEPWAVPLITSGLATAYYGRFPRLSAESVLRFMILDADNPSSIYCCLRAARESARSVRGAITSEMYEDLNSSWLEMRRCDYAFVEAQGVSEFLDWVKMRSHLFRGVTFGDAARRGLTLHPPGHLERADNTARIRRRHTRCRAPPTSRPPTITSGEPPLVSGFESYRKIYSDVITPRRVAELLILRDDMPRSLHSCMNFIHETLERLCDESSREIERASGELHAKLHYGKTDDIIRLGLHEYLMDFLARISALGNDISRHFLVPTY
jgi:uncharacterized alpha-E superfamily protein